MLPASQALNGSIRAGSLPSQVSHPLHTCRPFRQPRKDVHLRRTCVRTQAEKKPFRTPKWDDAFYYLTRDREFSSTDAREIHQQLDSGKVVLIDVRPVARHKQGHPKGAVNVPLYQKTDFSKFEIGKYFKGLAYLANGVEPVEANPDFMEQVKAAVGNKGVALMCETGGSLEPNPSFPTGKNSRSLLATHRVLQSGEYPRVLHLRGGTRAWVQAGLPFDGSFDEGQAGRTPSAVQ